MAKTDYGDNRKGIAAVPADGTYWAVKFPAWTFPCHFNPAAKDLEHVRRHYPQAGEGSKKITGLEFMRMADELKEAAK